MDYQHLVRPEEARISILGFSIFIGLMLLFAYLAFKGRNWARVVFLVLVLVGLFPALAVNGGDLQRNAVLGIVGLVQTICQVVAIILFFLPSSNVWYREIKVARGD